MPRLFHKIFLWFWLGMVVVCLTLVGVTALAHSRSSEDRNWRNKYGPRVDLWARREAEVFDHDGKPGLSKYVASFVKEPGVHDYMFDEDGSEVLQREAPSQVLQIAAQVRRSAGAEPEFFVKERIIAEKTVGPSGLSYVAVITYPQPSVLRRRLFDFLVLDVGRTGIGRLMAILLVAGCFCFWLARQITYPIDKLRLATRGITNEHLETRVDETILARHDELADLGRDFDRMAERIDTLVTTQRRLLSDVSHSLRSPLARLSVALGLAREGANPETSEHLDRIEHESDRLNELIGQLLTMARVDSGVDLEEKKAFDLTLLVEEVAADGDYEARSRDCAVECNLPAECMIEGAPELLRVAIENVVRNAVRHTREGTSVKISLEHKGAGDGPWAVLQVRDYGPGIPEDAIAKLFRPFYQVPDSPSQYGSGLGLAITERIFRLHGGNVRAANAPEGGLIVTLKLSALDSNGTRFAPRTEIDDYPVRTEGSEQPQARQRA